MINDEIEARELNDLHGLIIDIFFRTLETYRDKKEQYRKKLDGKDGESKKKFDY